MPGPASFSVDEVTPLAQKLSGVQSANPSAQGQAPPSFHVNDLPLSFDPKSLPTLGGYQNPATQKPQFSNTLSDIGTSLIPGATGGVGEIVGGPVGGAIGTGIGQFFRGPIAEGRAPQGSDIGDALKAAGISGAISVVGRLPGIIRAAKTAKGAAAVEEARQVASGGIPSPPNPEVEQNVLGARLAPVKAEENAAWNKVYQYATDNTRSVPVRVGQTPGPNPTPIFQNQNVEGAIPISQKTLQFINDTKAELATSVGPLNPQMSQAARTLNQVTRDLVTDGQTGVSYAPFAGLKQLRSDLGAAYRQQLTKSIASPTGKVGVSYGTAAGTALRANLGEDIENGLTNWGNDAISDYATANNATKTTVKASVLNKLLAKNTNQVDGTLNVDNVINGLKQETSAAGQVFSAADRNKISQLMLSAKNVSPAFPGAGNFRGTNFALAGLSLATGHEWGAAYFTGKEIVKSLLGNETSFARIAAQLPSAPANSGQAKLLVKSFLRGMGKGIPATLISTSGRQVPAHTDGEGNIVPDFQSQ